MGSEWKTDLEVLLSPQRVAVVGASEKPGVGSIVMYNLRELGFSGSIYPVNPKYPEIFGHRCYPDLVSIPGPVDAVAVAVPARYTEQVLEQCVVRGIRACTIMSGGFAELNEEGARLQAAISRVAEEHQIRVCGPNCLGHLNLVTRTGLYSAGIPRRARPGTLAIVAQSGSMAIAMSLTLQDVGISHIISCGNQAVLDLSDYLSYLADDEHTGMVAVFLEGVADGRRFLEVAGRLLERGKPLVILKIGRSELGEKAALSHTGCLAGSDRVYRAAFREAGVITVGDLDEMVQTVRLLSQCPPPEGNGALVLAISGGQCGLIGDMASGIGLHVPELAESTKQELKAFLPPYLNVSNPLDVAGAGADDPAAYAACVKAAAADPGVGVVLVSQDAPAGMGPTTRQHYSYIMRAIVEARRQLDKPLVAFANHSYPCEEEVVRPLVENGIPYLQGTVEALQAVKHLLQYGAARRRGSRHAALSRFAEVEEAAGLYAELARGKSHLGEAESKMVLARAGVRVTRELPAGSAREAAQAAGELGFPVALKIRSPDITHKSDVGGVRLGLGGEDEVVEAYAAMMQAVRVSAPRARIVGVLVQEMAPEGLDFFLGASRDPQFGPILLCGLGGLYVELFQDIACGLLPIDAAKASELLEQTLAWKALAGARSRSPYDVRGLVDVMERVGALFLTLGDSLRQLDVNPVRVLRSGAIVLDALMVTGGEGG